MNDARRELNRFILHRTGFKPGDVPVTCPNCSAVVRDKYCTGCGHEVTAISYEILRSALQNKDITEQELLDGMSQMPGFAKRTQSMQELTEEIIAGKKLLLED